MRNIYIRPLIVGAVLAAIVAIVLFLYNKPDSKALMQKETFSEEIAVEPENPPYATAQIMSLADYDDTGNSTPNPLPHDDPVRTAMELEVISRSTAEKKRAAKQVKLDQQQFNKARLPPDSQERAVDEESWKFQPADPKILEGFATIEGKGLQPDDKDALEAQERAILATYVPKRSADLTTYSVEDAEDLIKKIYDARKQIPSYKKRDDGVYEVYEVKDKDPKIIWEDDVVPGLGKPVGAIGDYIRVPVVAEQVAANLDPFFEPRTRLSNNRADYTAFTPQLERMFAPSDPRMDWY